jgi:hypothetical protein
VKRTVLILALVAVAIAGGAGWYYWGPAAMPAGQPALVEITPQTLEQLRAEFNAAADQVRVVALLSPT